MAHEHVHQRPQRPGSVGNLFEHAMEFLRQRLGVVRQPLGLGQSREPALRQRSRLGVLARAAAPRGRSSLVLARFRSSCKSAGSSTIFRAAPINLWSSSTTCSRGRVATRVITCSSWPVGEL